ncbi:MAG: ABC transporter ATP-binding protein, partial [Clostridiales bacterium]|nr:ABC transporter ATP-binding protein [Clostridiales bacterium]
DEPTAGMAALARRQMWHLLKNLNGQNLTILLTTHYMEEAESLCGRVGMMRDGKLEEIDSPRHMIETLGRYAVDQTTEEGIQSRFFHNKEEAIAYLAGLNGETAMRNTTLEDVFLSAAENHS